MLYALTVERRPNYLHIKVSGQNTPETVLQYFGDVRNACAHHHCPNVLVEEHLIGPSLAAQDIFKVIAEGSKDVEPTIERIAYVDVNPAHDSRLLQVAENIAVNHGVNLSLFQNVSDAEAWLQAETASPSE